MAKKKSGWKKWLKTLGFAAVGGAAGGAGAYVLDPATVDSNIKVIGTVAGWSAVVGAVGYILDSPFRKKEE